ncbi:MAG: large subunit ribosomal protein L17 [Parcubacteria group bacterium Gr01-1014_56]|nr:MAG: large subunit ribosomal protein L17 [Parcubacteria group bacterium Gr01-1014_56]
MRHGNHNRKFGRETDQRAALLKSLARSLVLKGHIKTTEARAKEIRPMVEKLLTRSKVATIATRRALISQLGDVKTANKLIKTAEAYKDRAGGYIRIVKMIQRKGDASPMALIEFV